MAIRTWTGTLDGDWEEDGNWAEDYAPVSGDDVFFTSGSVDVTLNLDQEGVVLTSLNFGPKWTGSIDGLIIGATSLDYSSTSGTADIEGTFTTVNVQATSTDDPALTFTDATITTLNITGGNGTIKVTGGGSTLSGSVNMIGCTSAKLEIAGAVDASADLIMDAGTLLTYEEMNIISIYGGVAEIENETGTLATLNVYGGTCKYAPTGAAIITALTIYGGTFDMTDCTSPSHTITDCTLYAGGTLDERNGLSNAIYTNPIVGGGLVKCDIGREITIT